MQFSNESRPEQHRLAANLSDKHSKAEQGLTKCWPLQGYARLNNAEAALDVLREFWQQGGEPDNSMFEVLVNLCVRTGEFRKALQVSQYKAIAERHAQ